MHIHIFGGEPDPKGLLDRLQAAGETGGCVFSDDPLHVGFEQRLDGVLRWTDGEKLFPILWIHPYEENVLDKIRLAVERGVCGFKMICEDYDVGEPQVLEVLTEIARLQKPVFFHSGILWDGVVASAHNRPLHWEALLDVDGLRFSMGHCSWPWIDECIALYGEFMNARGFGKTAEMFFDLTPGTPAIYREELLTKLYTVGYDVGNNVLFGTDCSADTYRSQWAAHWLKTDRAILERLGMSRENFQKLYRDNLMRFLGRSDQTHDHKTPTYDDSHGWSLIAPSVRGVIEKWYHALPFPQRFDAPFAAALSRIPISDAISIEGYDLGCRDGQRNLLSFLYFCEALEQRYNEKGIDRQILLDTLHDIVRWTALWSQGKPEPELFELPWLARHLQMRLFQLGRLQFCLADGEIEIHIPAGTPLREEECIASIARALDFFDRYFPECSYDRFSCHSWLLDKTLAELLPADSNILKFQSLFEMESAEPNDAILRYVFGWNIDRYTLPFTAAPSGFAQRVKKRALQGGEFYAARGIIPKDRAKALTGRA